MSNRKYDPEYDRVAYFDAEEMGLVTRGLRELQESEYCDEETWNKIEELLEYLCEEVY